MCERPDSEKGWGRAISALGYVSLVFSCLFMAELLASVWAFGFGYFRSWFHCFDATVIVAAFVVDVLLKDVLEEVGGLVYADSATEHTTLLTSALQGGPPPMASFQDHRGALSGCGGAGR